MHMWLVVAVFDVLCFNPVMANDPQENVDVSAEDELSDEVLSVVYGAGGPGGAMPKGSHT